MVKKAIFIIVFLFLIPAFLSANESLLFKFLYGPAQDFTLRSLDSKNISLSDYKDKAVLLLFWTTWCPYCVKELKKLDGIYSKLQDDNMEVLAINVGESEVRVRNLTTSYSFPFQMLLDIDSDVTRSYGVSGVPTFILINKKGKIVFNNNYFPEQYTKLILE